MLIYNKHHQLLTLYQFHETSDVRGVYLPFISTDDFIPIQENDMWFVTATSLEEIPRQQIPTGIATTYQGEFPEATMRRFQTFGEHIMLEFITPIKNSAGEIDGICIIRVPPQYVMTR